MNKLFLSFVLSVLFSPSLFPQQFTSPQIEGYFSEFDSLCQADGGRLCGINLRAPFLFVTPERKVYANVSDVEGYLKPCGSLFVGSFPEELNPANSTIDFGGKHWAMVMLPVPEERFARQSLCMHEVFHYWQDSLHLPLHSYQNNHLEEKAARLYLQLEWNALDKALDADDASRHRHLLAALSFRAYRHSLFPDKVQDELAFEQDEGLPQYVGMTLAARSPEEWMAELHRSKEEYAQKDNLVRTFAYHSGALYGFFLEQKEPDWLARFHDGDDLGVLLQKAYALSLPNDTEAYVDSVRAAYDYASLLAQETAREEERNAWIARQKTIFLSPETLTLPLSSIQMSFDPNGVKPLGDLGTLYTRIRLVDDWGILEVRQGGSLITPDWRFIRIPCPTTPQGNVIETADWRLELNANYHCVPDTTGGFRVVRE